MRSSVYRKIYGCIDTADSIKRLKREFAKYKQFTGGIHA